MLLAFRALLSLLALCLSIVHPAPQPSQSSSPDLAPIQEPRQSPDEEIVRAGVEKYASAIQAGDIEAMRQLWNPQSSYMDSRLSIYQGLFTHTRIEFTSLKITRLEVMGDKAVSHLTTDDHFLYKKTGSVAYEPEGHRGHCRSFEWIRTAEGWKIEREFTIQDELAARIEAAASAREIDEILEKEKDFVTNTLISALGKRCERSLFRGGLDKALSCYQLQQTIAEKLDYRPGIADAWLGIGAIKQRQEDSEQALLFWRRALALYETIGSRLGEPLTLTRLSHQYHELGDYRTAFECANKALRLYEGMKHLSGTADALAELGHVYYLQNNFQQALACNERASLIHHELGNKIQIAILQFDIVKQHKILGDYDRALEIYQDILKQTEGHGDQAGVALILSSIGDIYARQSRYAEAREYYHKSLQAAEAADYNPVTVEILVPISQVYLAEGKFAEAAPLAERAVSLARRTANPRILYLALTSVGYCQLGLNNLEKARRAFAEAITIIEELRLQTAGGAEDRQRQFETGLNTYHGMLDLLARENRPQEALAFAERAKARALLDLLRQGQVSVQKSMTAEEQEKERKLTSELTRLNGRMSRAMLSNKPGAKVIEEIKSRLEKARLDLEAFQTSLYATHPELKVRRGEAPIIKAEELTDLLPDATSVLLEYVVTPDKSYLFAVTKASAKAKAEAHIYTLPIKREELGNQTEAFRRSLANRDLGFRDRARRLYDLLLKPAQAQLRGKTNIVISPDDKLWDLPFQALLAGDNRYVIEQGAVSYVPSLTVLRETAKPRMAEAKRSSMSLLAFGNPSLDKSAAVKNTIAMRGEKLEPLPEAEEEVKDLGRLYGPSHSKIYTGPEASEDRAKNEAGGFQVLHFATHGVLNNSAPMYSYLALAQADKNEDGLLEAWELTRMNLRADLAILSACETARGRFGAGEGVIGLSWAMFVAGVPAIVVSQWKVESAATRELMLGFHRNLVAPPKEKLTKAEALRQAALKLMKNPISSHPFYWAGFVLVGAGG